MKKGLETIVLRVNDETLTAVVMSNYRGGFDLDVDTMDSHYGVSTVTLDALEVYQNLKEYFRGTRYE